MSFDLSRGFEGNSGILESVKLVILVGTTCNQSAVLQTMFERPVLPNEDTNGGISTRVYSVKELNRCCVDLGGAKRARVEDTALSVLSEKQYSRPSSLLSPIMLLTGHERDIFVTRFIPDGM